MKGSDHTNSTSPSDTALHLTSKGDVALLSTFAERMISKSVVRPARKALQSCDFLRLVGFRAACRGQLAESLGDFGANVQLFPSCGAKKRASLTAISTFCASPLHLQKQSLMSKGRSQTFHWRRSCRLRNEE